MPKVQFADTENDVAQPKKLFGRQRPIHDVLGGGKVSDLLLWKNTKLSAAVLMTMTLTWILFEVFEYNLVTLICHISITGLLMLFIWCNGSDFFNWNPPKIPEFVLQDSTFRELAMTFHTRFTQFLREIMGIAYGKDPGLFFLTILSLYVLSIVGNYFSFLNLFFLGSVAAFTLPYLYERYEREVDHFAGRLGGNVKRTYEQFDSKVLNKIPRGKKVR